MFSEVCHIYGILAYLEMHDCVLLNPVLTLICCRLILLRNVNNFDCVV